jgi:hypothetical protein
MIIKERPDKIFTAIADISPELALTREGDTVKLTYVDSNRAVINVETFDNLMYTQK